MTQLTKFKNLNERFLSLETEMTQLNKFIDRDETDEQVRGPGRLYSSFNVPLLLRDL
jgi:hypothetical protein